MRLILLIFITLLSTCLLYPGMAGAKLHAENVEYSHGETALLGYVAYDDEFDGKRPGILVVHEWTGLGQYVKNRCDMLASLGYVAFAADIYGKGVRPETHEEAAKVSGFYMADRKLMRERVTAGLNELRKNSLVAPDRCAAIGYCFGGAAVLELARSGADISAVVTFHGILANPHPENASNIKARVLVHQGSQDPAVDQEQTDAFIDEMNEADVVWQMNIYGGAVHSFTVPGAGDDPSKGAAYNKDADERSWQSTLNLFDMLFK